MFVCLWVCIWRHYKYIMLCIWRHYKMTLQTGTPGHKWRPGHREYKWRPGKRNYRPGHKWRPGQREYKWRPGHSKRNYRQGYRDTNDDRDTGNINDDQDTGTQLQRGRRGHRGIYINDDVDTGNIRLAITINRAQGAIVRKMRYRSEYGLFSHGQLLCCMFKGL